MDKRIGTGLIIISAIGFGLLAIFVKYAYAEGVNTLTMLSFRFFIASLIMWSVVLFKKEKILIPGKQILQLACLGIMGYGVMSSLFFNSVKLVPAAIASIILYTYPIIVTLLSAWFYHEPITKTKTFSLLLSSVGLLMVVGIAFDGLNPLGLISAGGAAMVYSFYIILSNRLVSTVNPMMVSTYVITSAAMVFNAVALANHSLIIPQSLEGWLAILGIAVFSTVIAILTFFQGMKIVGPSQASIISTLEPVVTTIVALILFAEKVSLLQVLGGIMIMGAVIIIQREPSTKNVEEVNQLLKAEG